MLHRLAFALLPFLAIAQTSSARKSTTPPVDANAAAEHALQLAQSGHCPEALPVLKRSLTKLTDKALKKNAGLAGIRCAMTTTGQADDALDFIRVLKHDYPADPEVLYVAVHLFSDLSIRASQDLLFKAPSSYQVHQLNAESLETQGKWDEAAAEYRGILEKNPNLPGMHFRIGRLILSKPRTPATFDEARKEFLAELAINPNDVASEYVLGEIARQSEQWPEAIEHFAKAAKLDPNFADAQIGLGRSLSAAGKPDQAIAPLEMAARMQPENPTPHFHLAIALRRSGRAADANKEFEVYKTASARANAMHQEIESGILGPQGVDPKEQAQQ